MIFPRPVFFVVKHRRRFLFFFFFLFVLIDMALAI